ncbi:nitrate reductase subunit beta [Escherichia coli]|nr:nitrate reductase subunit beta [Escherichia coli]
MKIRSQVGMVLNLDKCIGCHTCSVTCKNVWTGREGMEYAWFNNVETKPGIGYPKNWEDQEEWQGGWVRDVNGKIRPRLGSKMGVITKIFANPVVPQIDDYYEPFTFDYEHLHSAPEGKHIPTARPRSLIDGKRMDKVIWGPNWEELLGGEFEKRARDRNFEAIQKEMYGQFENTFMMYLPRLCEHCLNPSCVATCPSGAIYKREEDGIVLIDQDKCRGWRLCISGCPYKKIYFNWKSGKSEKCIFCYPRIESGQPTVCSETCVGRIRYLGVLLYDADRIEEAASTEREVDLYERQCEVFLDPHDPSVIEEALKQGIPQNVIEAAQRSPVYKMAMDWKLALPLHPEYRTLPMVWYVPPLSPIQSYADAGGLPKSEGVLPAIESLQLDCRELPDYLPLYLEYLSVLPDDQAKEGLLNVAPILALLGGRLKQREAPWYALFDALLQLAGSSLSSDSVTKQVNSEERDDTRQALDAVWEEEQVKFIEDNATACDSSPLNQYQRRFSQDVAPQYVDISAGGGK